MPLSERARVEVYLPDVPLPAYRNLLEALDHEFTYTFGGCTIQRGLDGSYLSEAGERIQDRVNLIYSDIPLSLSENVETVSNYADELKPAVFDALDEEAILAVVSAVYHSAES